MSLETDLLQVNVWINLLFYAAVNTTQILHFQGFFSQTGKLRSTKNDNNNQILLKILKQPS